MVKQLLSLCLEVMKESLVSVFYCVPCMLEIVALQIHEDNQVGELCLILQDPEVLAKGAFL